jgi:hypothetical protein
MHYEPELFGVVVDTHSESERNKSNNYEVNKEEEDYCHGNLASLMFIMRSDAVVRVL